MDKMEKKEQNLNPLKIVQVAFVVEDMAKTIRQFNSLWNVGPFQIRESEPPEAIVHGKQARINYKIAHAQVGPVDLELIEPGKGESIYREFLRSKREGLHHLAVIVPDIESELDRFREKGIGVLQRVNTPLISAAYMDTESVIGFIIEIKQHKDSPA